MASQYNPDLSWLFSSIANQSGANLPFDPSQIQWEQGNAGPAGTVGAKAAGGGVAGILGTIGALALAPETGGLSLGALAAIGGLSGLGGNLLGDAFSGSPLDFASLAESGVAGAVMGGIGGELSGGGAIASGETPTAIASPFGTDVGETVVPDFTGTGSITGAASPAVSSAPALTGADPALQGFASGSATATPATFGDPTAAPTAAAPPDGSGAPASVPADVFAGTPGNAQMAAENAVARSGPVTFDPASGANTTTGGDFSLGNIQKWLNQNKGLVSAGSLLASLGKSALFPSQIPGADMLNKNAGLAGNIAQNNAGGQLNPAQAAAMQQNINGQIAAIKAKYAQLGLSGSTAEQQDIQAAQNAAFGAQAQAITANTGQALNAIGAANASTLPIAQQTLADDRALSEAIAMLAAMSMYGGGNQQASQ